MKPITVLVAALTPAGLVLGRFLVRLIVLTSARRALADLEHGEVGPALSRYARDAVVRQGEGRHRWAGEHVGSERIQRFLVAMHRAGVRSEVRDVFFRGPLWALRVIVLVDERANNPCGQLVYENRVAYVLRTRWGRVVEHTDLVLSTDRLDEFEQSLRRRGVAMSPVLNK